MIAYALRRADRQAAEEAAAETFLIAWRRLDDVPPDSVPWLLGTARKVLANQRRSARRREAGGPHASLDAAEKAVDPATPTADLIADREAFATAFAALDERDREVLALTAWEGLEPREAAVVLGCTAAAFSVRLHRARRRLMKELRGTGHSLGDEHLDPGRPRPGAAEAR